MSQSFFDLTAGTTPGLNGQKYQLLNSHLLDDYYLLLFDDYYNL